MRFPILLTDPLFDIDLLTGINGAARGKAVDLKKPIQGHLVGLCNFKGAVPELHLIGFHAGFWNGWRRFRGNFQLLSFV